MLNVSKSLILVGFFGFGSTVLAAVMPMPAQSSPATAVKIAKNDVKKESNGNGGAKKEAAGGKGGGRAKILSSEARSTKNNRTKIDFEEAAIDGERKTPAGIAIQKNRPEHDYDLINLRLRWHPEMIESTANLETGKGR